MAKAKAPTKPSNPEKEITEETDPEFGNKLIHSEEIITEIEEVDTIEEIIEEIKESDPESEVDIDKLVFELSTAPEPQELTPEQILNQNREIVRFIGLTDGIEAEIKKGIVSEEPFVFLVPCYSSAHKSVFRGVERNPENKEEIMVYCRKYLDRIAAPVSIGYLSDNENQVNLAVIYKLI